MFPVLALSTAVAILAGTFATDLAIVAGAFAAAFATIVGTVVSAIGTIRNGRAIEAVREEVVTANSLKLGELADAAETRRIDHVPEVKRTHQERDHLEAVPPRPGHPEP